MSIRNKALDLLSRREHSRFEMKQKLKARFANDTAEIDAVLDTLEGEQLLNDYRFTEMFVRGRVGRKIGPNKIIVELKQKGVNTSVIDKVFDELAIDWCQLVKDLSIRKYGDEPAIDEKEQAKRIRFFQYKGFNTEQIRSVVVW